MFPSQLLLVFGLAPISGNPNTGTPTIHRQGTSDIDSDSVLGTRLDRCFHHPGINAGIFRVSFSETHLHDKRYLHASNASTYLQSWTQDANTRSSNWTHYQEYAEPIYPTSSLISGTVEQQSSQDYSQAIHTCNVAFNSIVDPEYIESG